MRSIQEFRNIRLEPSKGIDAWIFSGGPIWPNFEQQTLIRQCRRSVPVDDKPVEGTEQATVLEGPHIWCGYLPPHFGHFIADQLSRLPLALLNCPPEAKLLFSLPEGIGEPQDFFYDILETLGVTIDRVVIQRKEPLEVELLYAAPLGETLFGKPDAEYLTILEKLMDGLGFQANPEEDVYVSRARLPANLSSLAGESYLEECFLKLGVKVIWPEKMTMRQQLQTYSSARKLVFSEGSAIHGRQLLGEINQDILVIERRKRYNMARDVLTPRCSKLDYISAIDGTVFVNPVPNGNLWQGLTVLDETRLIEELLQAGIDLRPIWDGSVFRRRRDQEILAWIKRRLAFPPVGVEHEDIDSYHKIRLATVKASLASIGLGDLFHYVMNQSNED
ncbi:glycosyltransferase 61 family protein [Nioella sp.]|uniref:glycosyltransferase 61 family protein n=1 Tax=Nioella sp. TaxID=1912091 RepID=UPI003B5208A8